MLKQNIIELCEKHIEEIDGEISKLDSDEEYNYYRDFFRRYSINSLRSISKINPVDLAIVLAQQDIKDKKFSDIKKDIESFGYILETFDDKQLLKLGYTLVSSKHNGMIEDLIEAFSYIKVDFHVTFDGDMAKEKREAITSTLRELARIRFEEEIDVCKLLEYFKDNEKAMEGVITFLAHTDRVRTFFSQPSHTIEDPYSDRSVVLRGKKLDSYLDDAAKEIFKRKVAIKNLTPVESHYNKLLNDHKTKSKDLKNSKKAYAELINILQNGFKSGEIKDYQSMIEKIPDEDVRVGFLKLVYEHNMGVFTETKKTYDSLVANSSDRFIVLLQDNGISIEGVQIESIAKNSYDDVATMIKVLKGMFKDNNTIIKGLEIARLVDVLYLQELVSKDVLSIDSIITNTSLFDGESDARKVLDENIKALNEFGFNPSILGLNQDLLVGSELLRDGLGVLREYDLLKYIKGQNNYSFLGNKELVTKIDKFLELGYEGFIKEDITLLNEDNIDRIYALKGIGAMPKTKEELLDCLRSDRFLVSDDKLSEYIHDVVLYTNDAFKLDINSIIRDYDATNRTISINGVVLSKNRIKRNSNLGSFKAIITGSVLSMDEVNLLREELKNKELIKNS